MPGEGPINSPDLTAFLAFVVPFILVIVVAVIGVLVGRALRTRSRQKRRRWHEPKD